MCVRVTEVCSCFCLPACLSGSEAKFQLGPLELGRPAPSSRPEQGGSVARPPPGLAGQQRRFPPGWARTGPVERELRIPRGLPAL